MIRYGFADGLGYGFCRDCRPERHTVRYTPEPEDRCERCGRSVLEHGEPATAAEAEPLPQRGKPQQELGIRSGHGGSLPGQLDLL